MPNPDAQIYFTEERNMPDTYSQAVTENLAHMGTPAGEWRALQPTGMTETDGPNGQPVCVPEFDFTSVAGYAAAPTLYPAQDSGGGMTNCELCGHPIKNVYHLANDVRQWSLIVGSECVTHFEGRSGERLTKEALWVRNRAELRRVKAVVKAFEKSRHCRWMMRAHMPEWYVPQDVRTAYHELEEATQALWPDTPRGSRLEQTGDAAITRWANKKGAACAAWAASIEKFMREQA